MVLTIRPAASAADHDAIWRIFHEVVAAADTYTYPRTTTRDEACRCGSLGMAGPTWRIHRGEVVAPT